MTGPCARCGAPVTRDGFRSRCQGCSLSPAFCRCQPVAARASEWIPEWRRRDLAKILDHGRAA
jgi:hypothetical protein